MSTFIVVLILYTLVRIVIRALKSNSTKAYFIPSVAWYKAGVKTNLREDYKVRSRF